MSNIRAARTALVARILRGDGRASRAQREAAFANADLDEPMNTLVRKVVQNASRVTDRDVASVLAAGFDQDQTFEIVVCAAVGEAARQYDGAIAALDAALAEH